MLRGHFSKLRPFQLNTLPFVMFAVEDLLIIHPYAVSADILLNSIRSVTRRYIPTVP